mmetsp:Transcript_28708/g.56230  ORF Transcript_28708/g.56230 Transcript_28708/m.56230 type:complete len:129 (-) Transcript_28708:1613-1999(-)
MHAKHGEEIRREVCRMMNEEESEQGELPDRWTIGFLSQLVHNSWTSRHTWTLQSIHVSLLYSLSPLPSLSRLSFWFSHEFVWQLDKIRTKLTPLWNFVQPFPVPPPRCLLLLPLQTQAKQNRAKVAMR